MFEQLIGLALLIAIAIPVLLVLALVSIGSLKRRVESLEGKLAKLLVDRRQSELPANSATGRVETPQAPAEAESSPTPTPRASTQPAAQSESPTVLPAVEPPAMPAPLPSSLPGSAAAPSAWKSASAQPGPVDVALRTVKRWFTVGNVPVKIGMLVLLAGVAALLKYASDQGWLRLPIQLRLAGVSAAAIAALVFGWRQREDKRAFALALEGGAIGVLLLTVFAAFKLYGLLPAAAAFALSVVLVAGLCVLAVLQNSRTLALLGILAGFLAPIWLSSGNGNHVVLFSYYALLNAAIFFIAWVRPWRVLNLVGFLFTWGIGTVWGVLVYDPAKYASTQPFLFLFFAFYLLIPILYARKRPARRSDRIDGCLLFGTPLIAFTLEAALLNGARLPLAFHALGLAALYTALAWTLIRRERYAALGQTHALLAVGFATLAIPLALSARATASVFALEGAGLVWLGLKQDRRLPVWTGFALQVAAALAFFLGAGDWTRDTHALANPTCMGALLIAIAGFASAHWTRDRGKLELATACYLWALAWWCGNAINEIDRFVAPMNRADFFLAFAAITGWLAAEGARWRPARPLVLTTLAAFLIAIPLAFAESSAHLQPFAGYGIAAWIAFDLLGVRSLICLRASEDEFASWVQGVWWLVWPTVLSLLGGYIARHLALADGWRILTIALPWLAVTALALFRWAWLAMPRGARFDACRTPMHSTYFALLGVGWVVSLFLAAGSAPLPWMPVLNPVELAELGALGLAVHWLRSGPAPRLLVRWRIPLLSALAFALLTCMTLRTVHFWGRSPWNSALPWTGLAQTSLTIVWSVLGVVAWILGSRRGRRALWLAGAVLMGLVLAKLILVDRQHLGNLLGIGSFIAYGVLCTLVGYLAPAPPRAKLDSGEALA